MEIAGTTAPGYEGFRDAFAAGQADDPGAAQLCVHRHGEIVVDLWTDTDRRNDTPFSGDSLTVLRSSTKGVLATCLAILVDRGLLDVDAPVERYWPEFAKNGKEKITTAHILTHTAGLPHFPSTSGVGFEDLPDRERCLATLVDAAPLWEPGSNQGWYHAVTIGLLGDEVLRRITGMTIGAFLAENVSGPLGLDLWIGLPAEEEPRVHRHDSWGPPPTDTRQSWVETGIDIDDPVAREILWLFEDARGELLNTRIGHEMELSAGNGITNARALARMYAALIGEVDGVRLISREALEFFTFPRVRNLPLLGPMAPFIHARNEMGAGFDQGLGFQLGPVPGTFGHPGAGGVQGFADPRRGLAVSYTCTSMPTIYDRWPESRQAGWYAALAALDA